MVELVLIIGLFYPRIALIFGYLSNSILPNNIPLFWEIIMVFFIPRILFLIYIVINFETLPLAGLWLFLHGSAFLISYIKNRIESKIEDGW